MKQRRYCVKFCGMLSAALSAFTFAQAHANPLSFPEYEQELTVRFATPGEAETANASLLPLPGGAKCSFGTRWDDSSPKHLAKAAMLERAGVKGGFYLCGREFGKNGAKSRKDPFFRTGAKELVQRGHAVGNHTWTHPHMTRLSPDAAFRQIMTTRITLEDVSDHAVLSYAAPFGWQKKNWSDVSSRILVEKMLVETGHYVSGDNPLGGIPPDVFYPANRFSANDRKPNYKAFMTGLAKQTMLAEDGKSPRVTLGTHSWCDEAGNALQEAWIRKHCVRPDWVQLNDYEYGAYRYSYLNGKVSRKAHRDNVTLFSIRRFDPAALGDDIPLSISFSTPPLSVECGGMELKKDSNGYWQLPHDASRSCVAKVAVADENGVSEELADATMTIRPDGKASCVKVKIGNRSGSDFSNLYAVVHLPPGFSIRRRVFEIGSLAAGSSVERTVPFGDAEKSVRLVEGQGQLFASSLDYTANGARNRLWAMKEMNVPLSTPSVREAAMRTDNGDFVVAERGVAGECVVVIPKNSSPCLKHAATEFSKYVKKMTGVSLPVAEVPVQGHKAVRLVSGVKLGRDSFRLRVVSGEFLIEGDDDRSVLFGVYDFLENQCGCDWLTPEQEIIPLRSSIVVPSGFSQVRKPAFRIRELSFADVCRSPDFAAKLKLNGYMFAVKDGWKDIHGGKPYEQFDWWWLGKCHTILNLMPVETYFKTHPEYYAEIDGKRQNGPRAQLCLTNPDVVRIVASKLLARIEKRYPKEKIFGVSQSDSKDYCRCANCAAGDAREESHAGTNIEFVNKLADIVAEKYPDVIVETLAYQYTRKPPKYVRPRPNVMICLCTDSCDFSRPLRETRFRFHNENDFIEDMKKWCSMTKRVHIWNYAMNFRYPLHAFPNIYSLKPNLETFLDCGIEEVYEEGTGRSAHQAGSVLKTYLLGRLLWDPRQPLEPLLDRFYRGYYGAGAEWMRKYMEELHAMSLARDEVQHPMLMWGTISSPALKTEFFEKGAEYIAKAAEAVKDDPVRSENVRWEMNANDYTRIMRSPVVKDGKICCDRSYFESKTFKDLQAAAKRILADTADDLKYAGKSRKQLEFFANFDPLHSSVSNGTDIVNALKDAKTRPEAVTVGSVDENARIPKTIKCKGLHEGHLQGVDAQGTNIWWSFTRKIVRTDLDGNVLASCFARSHQGDLCVKGDTLYVAVNHGSFSKENKGNSFVYSFDAMTLKQKKIWKLDVPMGAGGMTWKDDRFYVVGGLVRTLKCNYVYEYDTDFKLIKRHELKSGYTVAGIQTATFIDGDFLFGIYGGKGNPSGILRCSSDFKRIRRYRRDGSLGIASVNGRMYTGATCRSDANKKKWKGSLRLEKDFLGDKDLLNCPWYKNGVYVDVPVNAVKLEIGSTKGEVNFELGKSWRERMKDIAAKGYNAIFFDVADGYEYPSHRELAAKGAWSEAELMEALSVAREEGIEPIPYMDFVSSRNAWLGAENLPSASKKSLELCCELIRDVGKVFGRARYFRIETNGLPDKVINALNMAVLSYSCPWSLKGE